MFNKIIHFVKYHNAFVIISLCAFIGFSAAMAASPDLRESVSDVLVSSEETIQSINNSQIIEANLSNFDFSLQIQDIKEDNENYYIHYTFKTLAVMDGVWQEVIREKIFTADKEALGKNDLGLYVTEELTETMNWELSYLKEAQKIEKEKGQTQKIVAVQYAGLIGKFLNPNKKIISGYKPVIQPQAVEIDESNVVSDQSDEILDSGFVPEENQGTVPVTGTVPEEEAPEEEAIEEAEEEPVIESVVDEPVVEEVIEEELIIEEEEEPVVEAPILSPTESEEENRESAISEPNQDDLEEIGKEPVVEEEGI